MCRYPCVLLTQLFFCNVLYVSIIYPIVSLRTHWLRQSNLRSPEWVACSGSWTWSSRSMTNLDDSLMSQRKSPSFIVNVYNIFSHSKANSGTSTVWCGHIDGLWDVEPCVVARMTSIWVNDHQLSWVSPQTYTFTYITSSVAKTW